MKHSRTILWTIVLVVAVVAYFIISKNKEEKVFTTPPLETKVAQIPFYPNALEKD